mmetsp:Transcript_88103/g.272967  ORF Transcript_88103/g.272967 Transcript_88103/m.272967 type:complete len:690 (+) Transcript_88103:54-2123(+)
MAPATKKAGSRAAKKDAAEQKAAAAGGGLSKFFGAKPPKEEVQAHAESPAPAESPTKAASAPVSGLQKLFAAQKATPAPAPAAAPAASEAASPARAPAPPQADTSPAGGKPQLSEEQLARIEENRRRARERQQAKRSRDEPEASSEQQTPSPLRPAAARVASAAAGEAVSTPEKVVPPHQERRQSPAPAMAQQVAPTGVGAGTAGSVAGRFGMAATDCKAWMQYNSIYGLRLKHLRKAVLDEAHGLWSGMLEPASFLSEITGYRRCSSNGEAVIIGVLFKELKGRPNVIEQYKDMKSITALRENSSAMAMQRLHTERDTLWLEDSSMRLQLIASGEQVASLPTGAIVGVRGSATEDGHFKVSAICFPRMASPPPLPVPAAEGEGPFLALLSGLAFGREAEGSEGLAEARARAVAFLLGEGGASEAVQRVIVCGGVFEAGSTGAVSKAALQEADETLARLAGALRVDVMPGRADPTNLTLPQMPLHPHLFKRVREFRDSFKSVTNPYECSVDGVSVLGHAGQPVEDILRCTSLGSPLEALAACLRASHIAPTAPDTLPTQPFSGSDPFILGEVPHVFFSGGHAEAAHQWHPSARGAGGTLCAVVPAFHKKPAVVLVSLRDPRDVRVKEFGEQGTKASEGTPDVQMGTVAEEQASTDADAKMGAGEEQASADPDVKMGTGEEQADPASAAA